MTEYIYFVKCPNCEDEPFSFFDEAEQFACGCLSKKPIITQVEVNRNDFGECTDSCDLGTIWSWEDLMGETDDEPALSIFTKDAFASNYDVDNDPEFLALDNTLDSVPDNFRKPILEADQSLATNKKGDTLVRASSGRGYSVFNQSGVCLGGFECDSEEDAIKRFNLGDFKESAKGKPVPDGMTIEQLVEEMEANEDMVECTICEGLFDKEDCRKRNGLGYICPNCEETLNPLSEELYDNLSFSDMVADSINHLLNSRGMDPYADDFADEVISDLERNYFESVPENPERYINWCDAVICEVARQVDRLDY